MPKGDWEAQSMNALLTLKHWANQAKLFDRQRNHKGTTLIIGQHPGAELIEAQMIEDRPESRPLTDKALDENDDMNLFGSDDSWAGAAVSPEAGAAVGPANEQPPA